jgi:acyl carrier protein
MIEADHYSEQGAAAAMSTSNIVITETARPTHAEIMAWCREVPTEKVDPDAEFDALGFDSAAAVALVVEVGAWLNLDLEPAALFDYPTITTFADYLSKQ